MDKNTLYLVGLCVVVLVLILVVFICKPKVNKSNKKLKKTKIKVDESIGDEPEIVPATESDMIDADNPNEICVDGPPEKKENLERDWRLLQEQVGDNNYEYELD